MMKKYWCVLLLVIGIVLLFTPAWGENTLPDLTNDDNKEVLPMMKLEIGNAVLYAEFADTDAARALREKLTEGCVTIAVSNYGGWEKVGDLPWSLPADDVHLTAQPGDIMLYTGRSIVLFYGSNSWAYTRLGRVVDCDASALQEVLGGNENSLTLSLAQ